LFAKAAGYEFIPASQLKARLSESKEKSTDSCSDTGSEEEDDTPEKSEVVYRKKSKEDSEIYTGNKLEVTVKLLSFNV